MRGTFQKFSTGWREALKIRPNENGSSSMKKRLKKKKSLGEYAVYGVSIRFRLGIIPVDQNAFIDDFLENAIDSQNLSFGGGGRIEWQGVVEPLRPQRIVSEQSISFLNHWLHQKEEVQHFEISGLWDIHYAQNPFEGGI